MAMKAADVRAMTIDQIDDEVLKLKKEQFNLRFQRATGQLENTVARARHPPRHRAAEDHRRAEALGAPSRRPRPKLPRRAKKPKPPSQGRRKPKSRAKAKSKE